MEVILEHLNPPHAALLIIDVQNDYCHHEGALAGRGANLSMIAAMKTNLDALIRQARLQQVPVIFIGTSQEEATDSEVWLSRSNGRASQTCRAGTWGAEFFDLHPQEGDIVVWKHRYSAFIHTRLDTILRANDIKTLIVTGVSTNVCVESTARDGFMLDYRIVLPEDACAAFVREAHDMTLYNINQYFGAVTQSNIITDHWASLSKT